MMNKRLLQLLRHSRKYIGQTVLWSWISMLCNIGIVFIMADTLHGVRNGQEQFEYYFFRGLAMMATVGLRHVFLKKSGQSSYLASADVKRTLREKIFSKLLSRRNACQEAVATSELLQVSMEGVEQLEVYYSKYIPQLFYSVLAPATLFAVLMPVNWKVACTLFLCVPLIPLSIIVVQKLAKRLLSKYWGKYTGLGDHFLENLQGLTTLKIYQADERKQAEMDEEAEQFRKITYLSSEQG